MSKPNFFIIITIINFFPILFVIEINEKFIYFFQNALADGEIRIFFKPGKLISSELIQKMFQECEYVKFLKYVLLIK